MSNAYWTNTQSTQRDDDDECAFRNERNEKHCERYIKMEHFLGVMKLLHTCCAGSVWYTHWYEFVHSYIRTRSERQKIPIEISLMWLKWPSFNSFFLNAFMSSQKSIKTSTVRQSKLRVRVQMYRAKPIFRQSFIYFFGTFGNRTTIIFIFVVCVSVPQLSAFLHAVWMKWPLSRRGG